MGIATGEAELRDADYFGTLLNRAARVMTAGHGGQTLVADSTAVLLQRVDLVGLGPRRLRDLPVPVGVFQVRAPGLRTDFPPLRALDTSPGNLRPQLTSFIGREHEVAEVQAALKAHRLVTLTGVGGVGKSRLATEVAARLADEFLTVSGFSNWRRLPIRGRCPTRWRRCWASPNNRAGAWLRAWPPRWRAGRGCWCSTTALGAAAGVDGAFAVAWTMSGWRTAETQRRRLSGRA